MKIEKQARQVEVIETREIDEVVLRMTPDEARFLLTVLGATSEASRIENCHRATKDRYSTSHKAANKILEDPEKLSELFHNFYMSLVEKLS